MKNDTQQTPEPFWNVFNDGSVCIGNTHAFEVRRRYEVHPELLAALHNARDWLIKLDPPYGGQTAAEIDAAIAKAGGASHTRSR